MDLLDELLAANTGVLIRSELPDRRSTIGRACRSNRLTAVFPGVYVDAAHAREPDVLALAALRRFPDGVLRLHTAARMTYWPSLTAPAVQLAGVRQRHRRPGFDFSSRAVPADWVYHRGLQRLSAPEYTAVDLAALTDGDSIDQLLRTRMGTTAGMRAALHEMAGSTGQKARRRLLLDSRDEPWSAAERAAHRILRAARIRGWKANYRIRMRGRTLYLDIAFPGIKLVIEIDGREYHQSAAAFETDRERQNLLILGGWIVIRFTWQMLTTDPDYVVRTTSDAIVLATAR